MGNIIVTTNQNIYAYIDTKLDWVSFILCPERPTHQLALDNMNIPQKERQIIMNIIMGLYQAIGIVVHPGYALSDKKFCIHLYESVLFFRSNNNQLEARNTTSFCEKILIFISDHQTQICEPRNQWIIQTINIKEKDFDVPTNLWHKFQTNDGDEVFFYIHIGVTQGYQGVLFAVNKNKSTILQKIKTNADKHYTKTFGRGNTNSKSIGDILGQTI